MGNKMSFLHPVKKLSTPAEGLYAAMEPFQANRRLFFMRQLGVGTMGCGDEYPSETTWGESDDERDPDVVQRTLFLKRAILSPDTDDTEVLLELEVKTDEGVVEKFPFLYMSKSTVKQMELDIAIPDTATIRLVKGTGVVTIMGEIIEEWREMPEETEDEEEEEEDDNEEDESDIEIEADVQVNGNVPEVKADLIQTRRGKRKTEEGPATPTKKSRTEEENKKTPAAAKKDTA